MANLPISENTFVNNTIAICNPGPETISPKPLAIPELKVLPTFNPAESPSETFSNNFPREKLPVLEMASLKESNPFFILSPIAMLPISENILVKLFEEVINLEEIVSFN